MPTYAVSASYNPQHWSRLAQAPAAAGIGLRRVLAAVGGSVTSMHWALDTLELVAIVNAPDAESMAAVSISMAATGVFAAFTTRQLVESTELADVLRRADAAGLLPPGEPASPEGDNTRS
ncbi:MAG: GYD domain-containing protein [Actinomycetota bacterium]|nr:GYD domain-containing protein [Actinomycetota bacterium]